MGNRQLATAGRLWGNPTEPQAVRFTLSAATLDKKYSTGSFGISPYDPVLFFLRKSIKYRRMHHGIHDGMTPHDSHKIQKFFTKTLRRYLKTKKMTNISQRRGR
ncbi:hypothetical protein, partial [Butyricicoccus sp.]|uniref:hypothetical protein n=1 Tax=Butyricicoccus sp. TaxID=2049021 RepID=UPI003F18F746